MNVARADPMESVLLSMLLEHELELRRLRRQLQARADAPGGETVGQA